MSSKKKHLTIADLPDLSPDRAVFVVHYMIDNDVRRAAISAGLNPDDGYKIRNEPAVIAAIQHLSQKNLTPQDITPEWQLQSLNVLYNICLQRGSMAAALGCLREMGKHASVDAYAAEKVKMTTDQDTIDRLMRERKRRIAAMQREKQSTQPSFM